MKFLRINCFLFFLLIVSLRGQANLDVQYWKAGEETSVYFVESHDLPIVDIGVSFGAGSVRDTPKSSGLAYLTHRNMSLGAGGLDDVAIDQNISNIGAKLTPYFDADKAGFKLRTVTQHLNASVSILSNILHQPDFPSQTLNREIVRVTAQLTEEKNQPDIIAMRAFMQALFNDHPYGLNEKGEISSIRSFTRENCLQFYQQYYQAKNTVITLVGDLTKAQAVDIANLIVKGLPKGGNVPPPLIAQNNQARLIKLPFPSTQAVILLGSVGVTRHDPDYFPLYVGNYILGGGGFASRLMEELREKRGLTYGVHSYFLPMSGRGIFEIGLKTKVEQKEEALALIRATLKNFLENEITEQELKNAKDNLIGGFPLNLDSNAKILDYLITIGFYNLPPSYLNQVPENISRVTKEQIQSAFNLLIDQDNLVTVVLGGE